MGEVTLHYSNRGRNPHYFDERYEIFSTIGRGKASVVYLAGKFSRNETIDIDSPPVALKVLLNTDKNPEGTIKRIKRESLALLSCNHPNIIRMHDYVARSDACYISMEYAKYGDLKKLFSSEAAFLSPLATLKLVQKVLDGIGVIHNAGIIHRDIKPENLLLNEDYQVKICDFSVCLLQGEKPDLKLVSDVVGTIDYLPPECLRGGEYSEISDLYSVAITCFELLTGCLPFRSRSINQSLERKVNGLIEPLPENVKNEFPGIEEFFEKALSPDHENRFQNNIEMNLAIDQLIAKTYLQPKNHKIKIDINTLIGGENLREKLVAGTSYLRRPTFFSILPKLNIRTSARLFFLSFLMTIAAFSVSYLANELGNTPTQTNNANQQGVKGEFDSTPRGDTLVKVSELLNSNPGIGILHGLYTENKDYRFVVTPLGANKILFGLLVKGWEPVEIDLESLVHGKPVHVVGKGVDVLLKVDSLIANQVLEGTFENIVTARTGKWSLRTLKQ